ncbi:phosphoribosylformylglycinamidine cyclo-ligase [Patescibacteria group bacterium]|nr:phosphoribosylformylglycinamidine cyclo-ligase [Patescibacteria group bacterium]MBU1954229.1 phosphoribosylformylglycinamidine cyclo-ligase [Patescibacteria group bacterium]
MATYKESGVNISMGDRCSALAYGAAKKTFPSRKGLIGKPVVMDGGFSGALDFGKFYLIQNCDGVGSKIAVAEAMKKYDTLGFDLLAMVADDAICVGAETVSITNTIDTNKVSADAIGPMMDGLRKACIQQKVVIPGGEIAEMPDLMKGNSWNAAAVGIVGKTRFITGRSVRPGDKIIALRSRGFRSNGFSLVRYILRKNFGTKWFAKKFDARKSWGEAVLAPSIIYSAALLELLGRYGEKRKVAIKALAHVTGGGIPGNITRVLGGYGAELNNLFPPHKMMLDLQGLGKVADIEAYKTWNMGVGMLIISNESAKIEKSMTALGIKTQVVGRVTKEKGVRLVSRGKFQCGKVLQFS